MKRTTIFIDEPLERELQSLARRARRPVAALVREAVARYVVEARGAGRRPLGFIASGSSGRRDIAQKHEELLFAEEAPPAPGASGAAGRPKPRARGAKARRRA